MLPWAQIHVAWLPWTHVAACLAPWIGDDMTMMMMMMITISSGSTLYHLFMCHHRGRLAYAILLKVFEIRGTFVPSNARQALIWFGVLLS